MRQSKAKALELIKENTNRILERQKELDKKKEKLNSIYIERIKLAEAKVKEHKLDGWQVTWDNAKTRLGYCSYTKKLISFSKHIGVPVR